jgi:rod shape determining protein RodA
MTASALTRPGERERLSSKIKEIDWGLVLILCAIGGVGAMMLYSVAPLSWSPWAAKHAIRFVACVVMMLVLTLVPLRIWSAIAYPACCPWRGSTTGYRRGMRGGLGSC